MKETIIASSILIVCIVLLRKLCKRKISAGMQYALWLIVALRLLMPGMTAIWPDLMPESGYSILNVTDRMEKAAQHYVLPQEPSAQENIPSEGLPFLTEETAEGTIVTYLIDRMIWHEAIQKIWYAGMALSGLWMAAVNFRFMRGLYKSRLRYAREDYELPVYTAAGLFSPCLYGLPGKMAVYLPEEEAGDEKRVKHILAHELCHYKHKDVWWSLLRCILLIVYWFDPLVWLAAVLSKQDCELACDEAAVRMLGEEERIAYGKTLVSLIVRKTKAADIVCTATTMTAGAGGVKERIRRIAESPRRLAAAVVPALVAAAVIVVFTFTGAEAYPEGTYLLEGENSFTVTTSCFQVTFPEDFAKKASYRGANGTDILVYHRDSGLEVGRFCMAFYEEAVRLADTEGKEIILIGDYGANGALRRYISLKNEESGYPVYSGTESVTAGVPGTDSNIVTDQSFSGNTAVGASGGVEPIPAPELVKAEIINLPYRKDENYDAVDVEDETTYLIEETQELSDNPPKELTVEHLPDEQVTEIYLSEEQPCYLYIPADYAEADEETQAELSGMNQTLTELADSVTVLYVSREAMQKTLETLVENRSAYVGDNVRVSHIVSTLPAASGIRYQFLELQTATEPYAATLYYRHYADTFLDADIPFLNAVLLFSTVENLEICDIRIYNIQSPEEASYSDLSEAPYEEIHYRRGEMEELFGELYPCSETREALTGLYNRALEYLQGEDYWEEG
ncbi:MAG: DUF4825 domain-containing protein [Blautia sp.]|nr:DUF4825 domain-containing protein [Blautia sp.]MCM1200344.1 DUF4825 domain-containing protein [Bacteroides fragilis]